MLGIRLLLEAVCHQYTLSFRHSLGRMSEDTVMSSDCLVPLNKDGIWFSYNLPNTDERPLLRNTCLKATRIIYQSRDISLTCSRHIVQIAGFQCHAIQNRSK